MTGIYYNTANRAFWKPETAFRTNAHGLDTINAVGDTMYALPITPYTIHYQQSRRTRTARHIPGRVGFGDIGLGVYAVGTFNIVGDLRDMTMLKHWLHPSAWVETGSSPGVGYTTRTAREGQEDTISSFQLLVYNINTDATHSLVTLLMGCVVTNIVLSCTADQQIQVSIDGLYAKSIAGNALTTDPSEKSDIGYDWSQSGVTFTLATTPIDCHVTDWILTWNSGITMHRDPTNAWPNYVLYGDRTISVGLKFTPTSKTWWSDTIETANPATDDDLDITLKLARDATYDFIQFAFEKMWPSEVPNPMYNYNGNVLQLDTVFIIKPITYAAGAKCTITDTSAVAYPT